MAQKVSGPDRLHMKLLVCNHQSDGITYDHNILIPPLHSDSVSNMAKARVLAAIFSEIKIC